MSKKNLGEAFKSSFTDDGQEFAAHPVDTGSTKRPADKDEAGEKAGESATPVPEPKGGTGDPSRPADKKPPQGDIAIPKTKSGMIVDLITRAAKLKRSDLANAHANVLKALGENVELSDEGDLSSVVAEDLAAMFEGTELSEEFRAQATALFEAAVNLRVATEVASIQEAIVDRYTAMLEEQVAEINAQVDAYVTEAVNEWIKENKLAISAGVRADISESFISGLKTLFAEHYVEIPDDKVDVVEELSANIVELEARLAEQDAQIALLEQTIEEQALADIVEEATRGLTQTQADRLRTMVEGISFSGVEDYRNRVAVIRNTLIESAGGAATKAAVTLSEETVDEEDTSASSAAIADPVMQRYAAAISRLMPKNS